MERREEEEGGGWTGRRHSGEHAQQPHSSPQLGLCAAFLPILLLRELLYNHRSISVSPPALLLLVVRPSAWESGREGRPAIFERIFPAASLPSSPPHAGRPRRRRGIYRGGSSSPHYRIRRGGDTIHTGIRTRARAGLPLQIALSRFQHDHDSIGRAGNGLAHFANTRTCTRRFTLGLGAWSRSQLLDGGRGSRAGLWGPCKAATEHEAAAGRARVGARARPSSPALTVSPSLPPFVTCPSRGRGLNARAEDFKWQGGRDSRCSSTRQPK